MQLAQSIERYGEGHPVTSRLLNQVGNVHFRRGDFTRAASCYERAAQCESEQQHIAWLNLGTVYWRTNQVDTAIDYLKRARQQCRRRRDAAGGVAEPVHNNSNSSNEAIQASVYHQLGLCYALHQDYPRSLQALHKAYNIRVQQHGMDHHTSIAQTLDAMGKVYWMMGEYDAAIHCHGRALTIVTASASSSSTHPYQRHQPAATTNTRSTMESLRNLAAVFRAAGRSSDLLETLSEQLRLLGSSSPSSDHPTTTVEEQQLRAEIARLQNELAGC
jgi:tetratricopeptide (TPR) repeat protein